MFDTDGAAYSYGTWSTQGIAETQNAAVETLLAEGLGANMIRFETGTVFKGAGPAWSTCLPSTMPIS